MIQVQNLQKAYPITTKRTSWRNGWRRFSEEKIAVDKISFQVNKGEAVGYIGPNGAGKSTTIKMLCGILHPTSGELQVAGLNPQKERKKLAYRIGVVFGQKTQLWWELPLRESYEILQEMYQVSRAAYQVFLEKADALLGIGSLLDSPVRKLSLGQRMRADLAAALIHDPDLLILDEPTIGLDIWVKQELRQLLKELHQQGKTILLTTHDLDDIEFLCPRVIVLSHGKILFDGKREDLLRTMGLPSQLVVTFRETPVLRLGQIPDGFTLAGKEVTANFDRSQTTVRQLLDQMGEWGEILDIRMTEPNLESVIGTVFADAR